MEERVKSGNRLLLALASQVEEDAGSTFSAEGLSIHGVVLIVASVFTLLALVVLCACKEGKSKERSYSNGKSKGVDEEKMTSEQTPQTTDPVAVDNGGSVSNRNSVNMSKHSRQASSASSSNIRPPSLRELPEPPVDAHHSRNTSMSGVVTLPAVAANSINEENNVSFINRSMEHGASASVSGQGNSGGDPDSNGYDHFGPKTTETPPGYDHLGAVIGRRSDGQDTPTSEISGVEGHHYAQPKERTYDVVKDVKAVTPQLHHSDSNSQIKEEDPYNQIGDSDNTVSSSFIKRTRQSIDTDTDDLYATVGGDSDGSFPTKAAQAAMSKPNQPAATPTKEKKPPLSPPSDQPRHKNQERTEDEEEKEEDEYAVVNKPSTSHSGGGATPTNRRQQDDYDISDIPPYNTYRPPEPPRLYDQYSSKGRQEDEDLYEDGDLPRAGIKEHTYSKVTARESLASMTARNALNPYEMVPDLPENTYATVEGGSGDGVVPEVMMRHRLDSPTPQENRLSQNSDTYAEIGISGGGLTTSVISNTSISSNSNNANSATVPGTSSGISSGAPIPPSLDSLHQMTKSQTSSEGDRQSDRTSDRYLASPEDWIYPGQFDNMGHSDGSEEDGYSTLTRVATITDVESGEVTRLPNYETIKDSVRRGGGRESLDSGNDPNYESVDETRAKVALLKARESNSSACAEGFFNPDRINPDSPAPPPAPHVSIVSVPHTTGSEQGEGSKSTLDSDRPRRMRKLNHDYEEVVLSPPSSPSLSQPPQTSQPEADSVRDRVLSSHTYEELPQVKQPKKDLQRKNDRDSKKKQNSTSEDKKKSKEDKRKLKVDEKKKGATSASASAAASASGGSGEGSATASWDGSKKSDSWETNRTRL